MTLPRHFFRREYATLVATLSRRAGVEHIAEIEDAVQAALMRAVEHWRVGGLPDNPSGWLFTVAQRELVGAIRQASGRRRILERVRSPACSDAPETPLRGEVRDDLLRMLFVCCDPDISVGSQVAFALKTLCGFSVQEIAQRLFISEANAYKRVARARSRLRSRSSGAGELVFVVGAGRLPAVQKILYLVFTEGYLSSHADLAIRRDLCDEAIRLTTALAEHEVGQTPETFALLALMHLHAARIESRQDALGELVLLEEQDRTRWNGEQIAVGLGWLARASQGDSFSRYHAEAGIAAEHCLAPSFDATRWDKVAVSYALLEQATPSPLHRLARAVAVAQHEGPAAGLRVLDGYAPRTWLAGSYQWSAVLADLHRRCGHGDDAARHREMALKLAPTAAIATLLRRRLAP